MCGRSSAVWWWFLILGILWTGPGHVRAVLPGRQPGRGGRARGRGLPVRWHRPARGGQPGPELALAVHHRRDPGGGRRDHDLRLAGHHPVRRVDPGGLVPDRLRHHAPGQRPGRPQAAVVVDRAAAGRRRAGPRRVGGPFLGAVAADAGDPGRGVGHLPRRERDLRRLLAAPRPAGGRSSWSPESLARVGTATAGQCVRRSAAPPLPPDVSAGMQGCRHARAPTCCGSRLERLPTCSSTRPASHSSCCGPKSSLNFGSRPASTGADS